MSAKLANDQDGSSDLVTIGASAPDFVLCDEKNNDWRLSDHCGRVVVLLFYPQNETLVCTRQLCSVRDKWKDYLETGAEIVGISPALPDEHSSFAQKLGLPLSLLADHDRVVTRLYAKHSIYPVSFTRAVIVIDAKGIIRSRDVMLRAFRPSDAQLITDIYSARGDAFNEERDGLRTKLSGLMHKPARK
ncbi:MAG: peroxiredoxin family protein [Pyrinomonadaceae bacterium]